MIDKNLRSLERLQDPLRLKLLQRRLGQGVYIQEFPRPIKVFNSTELFIDISKDENRYGNGDRYEGDGAGNGHGHGWGNGWGKGDGFGSGSGYGLGDGFGFGNGDGGGYEYGAGVGFGCGDGYGNQSGEPEGYYRKDLRERING